MGRNVTIIKTRKLPIRLKKVQDRSYGIDAISIPARAKITPISKVGGTIPLRVRRPPKNVKIGMVR